MDEHAVNQFKSSNMMYVSDYINIHYIQPCLEDFLLKDYSTAIHSYNVMDLTANFCRFKKFPEKITEEYCVAALIHDIGKLKIRDDILKAPRKLEIYETHQMRIHPEIGYFMASEMGLGEKIADAVLEHHEKLDGTGYPRELKGSQISDIARVITIIDNYEAMTSKVRPYQHFCMQPDKALRILEFKAENGEFDKGIFYDFAGSLDHNQWIQ